MTRPADRALALLSPEDRQTVNRWLAGFGLELDEIAACPPMRQLVDMLAACELVAQHSPPMGRNAAWRAAGDMLGNPNLIRTWYRWQQCAAEACDNLSEADDPEATLDVET